jgi:hypothetical protein
MFKILFFIVFMIVGMYVLFKICFPDDYTEVDVIMDEYKEMKKRKDGESTPS